MEQGGVGCGVCGASMSGARWSWMWSVDLAGVEQGGAGCGVWI